MTSSYLHLRRHVDRSNTYPDTLLRRYLVAFTHLSFIGLTSYFCVASFHTLIFVLSLRRLKRQAVNEVPWYPLQKWGRMLQGLHLWLFATVATFRMSTAQSHFTSRLTFCLAILTTVIWWGLLRDGRSFATRLSGA